MLYLVDMAKYSISLKLARREKNARFFKKKKRSRSEIFHIFSFSFLDFTRGTGYEFNLQQK